MLDAKAMMIGLAVAAALPGAALAQAATPADYVKMAGAGDQYELQSSKLVLGSTKDAKVRTFANDMIRDHTQSTAEVKRAAMHDKVKAGPPMLDADGKQMLSQLKGASGAARDRLYWQQQATAHQKALALHQNYASSGSAPALKAAAAKIAPVVQHHIDMLGQSGSAM